MIMDQRERWKKIMDLVVAVESFDGPLSRTTWPLRELIQCLNWYDFGWRAERAYLKRMKRDMKRSTS